MTITDILNKHLIMDIVKSYSGYPE